MQHSTCVVGRERQRGAVEMSAAEVGVLCAFVVCRRSPVSLHVVDGPVVVYACGEEVWCAFLGFGGLDGEHCEGRRVLDGGRRGLTAKEWVSKTEWV